MRDHNGTRMSTRNFEFCAAPADDFFIWKRKLPHLIRQLSYEALAQERAMDTDLHDHCHKNNNNA
ncbi:hypothetical protein BN2476_300218 [Paraburkholderia piptadeniae]|uniref:Uncharacterized protein n=1 Tax=Paraburkholderia piptadeniae TaxID=1701573 RepID=A0A1N7S3F4_9BURK|nr:hypothetical protein BN2476_300218 [Paraburkholderia piptadeniae]